MEARITGIIRGVAVTLPVLCAGCVTKGDHLVFGQSHTVGITVTGPSSGSGAEFTLGYKDRNIAIVPVTTTNADGTRIQLKAEGEEDVDAFSVLGQFSVGSGQTFTAASGGASGAAPGSIQVGLGKFFATGMAARNLADGFAEQMGYDFGAGEGDEGEGGEEAGNRQGTRARAPVVRKDATTRPLAKVAASQNGQGEQAALDVPLIFGQVHGVGIGIAGSVAEPGEFTLGYRDRDIAIVPLTMTDENGKKVQLIAKTPSDSDSFSVLGQFGVRAGRGASGGVIETGDDSKPGTRVTLGKFFATGIAARSLASGFAAQLAATGEKPDDGSGSESGDDQSGDDPGEAEGEDDEGDAGGGDTGGEGEDAGEGEPDAGEEPEPVPGTR